MTIQVHFAPQTISWFNARAQEKALEFKPPFQRNAVWLDKHKAYLIDTVLRSLPVPEVYVQKTTDEDGRTVYQVVDGQQRLRTLLEFSQGDVELLEEFTPGRGGHTWEDLTKAEKVAFWNYRVVVREIEDATEADLRDLFRRLNQNTVTLNSQEIRNARFSGDFITAVTELADQDYWAEQKIVSAREIRRMTDIEFMAELLIGIMHGPQNKKAGLDDFFASYEKKLPERQRWLGLFESARACIEGMIPDLRGTRWRGKSDYYSLLLATAELVKTGRIPAARQRELGQRLIAFGEAVTDRLSKAPSRKRYPKGAADYATAVEKAASDKDRRQARHAILQDLLK